MFKLDVRKDYSKWQAQNDAQNMAYFSNSLKKSTGIKSYSLRHNSATMMREAEVNYETVCLILGHSMGPSETQFYSVGFILAAKKSAVSQVI